MLLACEAGDDTGSDPCAPGGEPTLRIGVGEVTFEEVPDGDVELIHGPQGGYHVVLALEATHFDQDEQLLGVLSGTVGGEELAHTEPFVTLRCNPTAEAQQVWNLFLIIDEDLGPEDVHGSTMEVRASLSGASTSAEAEAEILVNYPDLE